MEKLNPVQRRIYEGLKTIGEALAGFYLDGVHLAAPECIFLSKANMLAHAAREIDGGLRDTFAPKDLATKKSALMGGKGKSGSGHLASILIAVGKEDPESKLANRWFAIARHFHSIAHRKHVHGTPADSADIISLWIEYEGVLDVVIGSFLGITNRLDVLLGFDNPDPNALPALKNLLANPRHAHYFYTRLDKPGWLLPLNENQLLEIEIGTGQGNDTVPLERWWPMRYLLSISKRVRDDEETTLTQIVDKFIRSYTLGEINLHPFSVSDLLDIIINLERYSFGAVERAFIEKFDRSGDSWNLIHSRLTESLADKLVVKKDISGMKCLFDYFFSFTTHEQPAISFFGEDAKPTYRSQPNVQSHYITELLHRHGDDIIELLGADAIRIVVSKIEAVVSSGSYNLSHGNPKSIEQSSQTIYSRDWEDDLVYFVRDYAVKLNKQQFTVLVDALLGTKIQVLQRLAIHFIRTHYEELGDRWWRFVDNTGAEDNVYIHEPYVLLKEQSGSFSDEQFDKVIAWIERLTPSYKNEDGTEDRRFAGSYRRRWITALQPTTSKSRQLKAEKDAFYRTWWSGKITDHPEFDSYSQSFIGPDYPMDHEEFNQLSLIEQIAFIQSFQPEHLHDTSEEGLADLLQNAAATQPEKYLYSLAHCLPLHSLYQNRVMDGLTEALRRERISDFALVLDFVEAIKGAASFQSEQAKKFFHRRQLAHCTSEFVTTVCFHHQRLHVTPDDVNRMIILVLNMISSPVFQDESRKVRSDYIVQILNSTTGRLYSALIALTQLWANAFSSKDEGSKWPISVKTHFTQLVSSPASKDIDFSIILGKEMPLLLYLDKDWVQEHVGQIFDEWNSKHFGYRLHASLYSASQLPEDFYLFFKSHGLFKKAVAHLQHESAALSSLMGYALFEWKFWKVNPDDDSILADVLAGKEPEQILSLVRTAYERDFLSPDELIFLWERLMPVFDATPALADQYPILLWLFQRLPKGNGTAFKLASDVLAKTKNGRQVYGFLRHLYQIAGEEVEEAGKLVVQVYQARLVTPFNEEELKLLVKQLYTKGFKHIADVICVELAEQGSLSLKDLYNEYS